MDGQIRQQRKQLAKENSREYLDSKLERILQKKKKKRKKRKQKKKKKNGKAIRHLIYYR